MLLYHGCIRTEEKTIGSKTIWKCAGYNRNRTGRVHTLGEEVVHSTPHLHVAEATKVEAKKAIENMKEIATTLIGASTQVVVAVISANLLLAVSVQLRAISS